jgi:hypothetical protein
VGLCTRPHAPRAHRVLRVASSHPYLSFSPPSVPCSAAASFSVIPAASHPSHPSTVPKCSPFSCDAAGTKEASCRPPEPLIASRLCRPGPPRRHRTHLVSPHPRNIARRHPDVILMLTVKTSPRNHRRQARACHERVVRGLFLVFHFLLQF